VRAKSYARLYDCRRSLARNVLKPAVLFILVQHNKEPRKKKLVNFPTKHASLEVSRQQNSIKSSRADSHFKLRRGCLPEKMELNSAELSLQKQWPHISFSRNCKTKSILWRKTRIFMQYMWVFSTPNSTLLIYNISTHVDSCLVGTTFSNPRTSARTES